MHAGVHTGFEKDRKGAKHSTHTWRHTQTADDYILVEALLSHPEPLQREPYRATAAQFQAN